MKIRVDSDEYKCWHEVGHATVCLHLGGEVDFIEFLEGDARGYARARCVPPEDIESERSVACAGFAAEFYLLDKRYAVKRRDDDRDINRIVLYDDAQSINRRKARLGFSFAGTDLHDSRFANSISA